MKRIFLLMLSAVLCLAGCEEAPKDNSKINIVTTVFAPYEFASEVAGDKAEVTLLLKAGTNPHTYEPSPKDMAEINNCDIFIYSGGENDAWAERIIDSADKEIIKIKMVDLCEKAESGHSHDEGNHYDEHVWTSPLNAVKITNEICRVLSEFDEKNKGYYKDNAEIYIKELYGLDSKLKGIVEESETDTIVFGDRFPFLHLAKEYDINYVSPFKGCADEAEPDAKTVAEIWRKVREDNIKVVFYTELSDRKMAETLCEGTNAKPLLLHSCHTISADEKNETYLSLMEKNIENLKEALS